MVDDVRARVVEVLRADVGRGTGFAVAADLVLTAQHVVADDAEVRVITGGQELSGFVVWRDPILDAALVRVVPGRWDGINTRWAAASGVAPVECTAIGYPKVQKTEDGTRVEEHIAGFIMPKAGESIGRYAINVVSALPYDLPRGGSPWSGMSGAAVLTADGRHVLGMLIEDPTGYKSSRLEAVPVARLVANAGFATLVGVGTAALVTVTGGPGEGTTGDATYPLFSFAREQYASPLELAEAMAQHWDAAVELFMQARDRTALRDWLELDVRDRTLSKTRLRRDFLDRAGARAAVAEFVATFAPHTPPIYAGAPADVDTLQRTCAAAIAGNTDAARLVTEIRRENVLRFLARHEGDDRTMLHDVAPLWDRLVARVDDIAAKVPGGTAASGSDGTADARALAALLDPDGPGTQLRRSSAATWAPQPDDPPWWTELCAATASDDETDGLAVLVVLDVLRKTAEAERARARQQRETEWRQTQNRIEQQRRDAAAAAATARRQEQERIEQERRDAAAAAEMARRQAQQEIRDQRERAVLMSVAAVPAAAVALAVSWMLGRYAVVPVVFRWRSVVDGSHSLDWPYVLLETGVGLSTLGLLWGCVSIRWPRKPSWFRGWLAAAVVLVTIVALPVLAFVWHAHERVRDAQAIIDGYVREGCGPRPVDPADAQVVAILHRGVDTGDGCRTATITRDGAKLGDHDLPGGSRFDTGVGWYAEGDTLVTIVHRGAAWDVVGLSLTSPPEQLWKVPVPAIKLWVPPSHGRLQHLLVVADEDEVLGVDLRTGTTAWRVGCPGGSDLVEVRSGGPTGMLMICADAHLQLDTAGHVKRS
ncbi:serine protease [Dactylosporangium sp. NPDC005572]|uniref:S1 family peptidase n=1 Tax=Dactylosporangium sp. NPDC005572 TaxID=3156889 RepID=UPI0033B1977B